MKKLFFLFAIFLSLKASCQPFFKLGASQILYGQGLKESVTGDSLIADSLYIKSFVTGGGGSSVWGGITGTLSNQTDLQTALNTKLNISDTASMLSNYAELFEVALKVNISDTNAMLSHYAELSELALKLNISDTATMLSNYAELSQLPDISGKLNISDTAAMLTNYAELSQVGEVNTGSNLGGGLANYSTKVGVDLQFNSFKATDFDLSSNVIGIDYTNSQAATAGQNGFLSATDWTTFNNKGIGTVTSVSGTTDRITSTGGATPVIDISATFEALLGKVASPLSQFAATTSAQLAGVLSDEIGSGAAVFATSNTYTLTGNSSFSASSDPADSPAKYYAGQRGGIFLTQITTGALNRVYIDKSGTVVAARLTFFQNGGSAQTSTMNFRLNNTTNTAISSAITNDATVTTFSNTALNVSVSAGDYFELEWEAAAWTPTNPTDVSLVWVVYIQQN